MPREKEKTNTGPKRGRKIQNEKTQDLNEINDLDNGKQRKKGTQKRKSDVGSVESPRGKTQKFAKSPSVQKKGKIASSKGAKGKRSIGDSKTVATFDEDGGIMTLEVTAEVEKSTFPPEEDLVSDAGGEEQEDEENEDSENEESEVILNKKYRTTNVVTESESDSQDELNEEGVESFDRYEAQAGTSGVGRNNNASLREIAQEFNDDEDEEEPINMEEMKSMKRFAKFLEISGFLK